MTIPSSMTPTTTRRHGKELSDLPLHNLLCMADVYFRTDESHAGKYLSVRDGWPPHVE
jgi:hypothetical protein